MDKLRIDIVSDVVCPWCVIGFINLQKAMSELSAEVKFEINWKPYELHPEIPENGYDKKLYMQQKFGDLSGKASPYKQIEEIGKSLGFDFNFSRSGLYRSNSNDDSSVGIIENLNCFGSLHFEYAKFVPSKKIVKNTNILLNVYIFPPN